MYSGAGKLAPAPCSLTLPPLPPADPPLDALGGLTGVSEEHPEKMSTKSADAVTKAAKFFIFRFPRKIVHTNRIANANLPAFSTGRQRVRRKWIKSSPNLHTQHRSADAGSMSACTGFDWGSISAP